MHLPTRDILCVIPALPYNDNYEYSICESCGKIGARENVEAREYCEYYLLEKPNFEKFPVCFSQQYFYGNQIALEVLNYIGI